MEAPLSQNRPSYGVCQNFLQIRLQSPGSPPGSGVEIVGVVAAVGTSSLSIALIPGSLGSFFFSASNGFCGFPVCFCA